MTDVYRSLEIILPRQVINFTKNHNISENNGETIITMAKKPYFFGKYYKCIAADSFSFALIDSRSEEGYAKQLITAEGSYQITDLNAITVDDQGIKIDLHENGLTVVGNVRFGAFHPLRKKAMGPFSIFSMECSHEVYSMYHSLSGSIVFNGKVHSFDDGYGYIEGDSGTNFPSQYIWYNSVGRDYGLTVAIATIPFGPIKFTGLLGFVIYNGKEYDLTTYNFAKIRKIAEDEIQISKNSYRLTLRLGNAGGHMLKAPVNGTMNRFIKENLATPTEFTFEKGDSVILSRKDPLSSLEMEYTVGKKASSDTDNIK